MSKSYGKYKTVGMFDGNNTEYYRACNRYSRSKNRQIVRNMQANVNPEDYDDEYLDYRPRKDRWREPTDGTIKINAKDINKDTYRGIYTFKNKVKK